MNAGKNWSALIPDITYMKTRQLTDDLNYDGFDVQVKWKGGSRNGYGGTAVLVDSVRVKNPYAIASHYNYDNEVEYPWVYPYTTMQDNYVLVYFHEPATLELDIDGVVGPVDIEDYVGLIKVKGVYFIYIDFEYDAPNGRYVADLDFDAWSIDMIVFLANGTVLGNVTDLVVDDAVATIKFHEVLGENYYLEASSEDYSLVADIGADGYQDFSGFDEFYLGYSEYNGGPVEVEIFWQFDTPRILVTGTDYYADLDVVAFDNMYRPLLVSGGMDYIDVYLNFGGPWFTDLGTGTASWSGVAGQTPESGELELPNDAREIWFGTGVKNLQVLPASCGVDYYADFEYDSQVDFAFAEECTTVNVELEHGTWAYFDSTVTTWIYIQDFTGEITVTDVLYGEFYSMIVPLSDDYPASDFALLKTGTVFITANVHDIAFILKDNMGNPLPAANTAVSLIRTNGDPVIKRGPGLDPDRILGGLGWSYQMHGEGWAVFYQLPGNMPYDLVVEYSNVIVYDEPGWEIEKLEATEILEITVNVYKLKLVIADCDGTALDGAVFRYVDQRGITRIDYLDPHGARDFGYVPGGTIRILGVWWKGVWVPFLKATLGKDALTLNPDGSLTLEINRNYDIPVKLYANILDITFVTWDLNKDN
ncbi:MAG: hypothetical protein NZ941_03545, partial [Candidatus Caldarchaeum sp.]|nr:hypothetical protein [Candidatus Caldarchaeum sp.]